MRRSKITSYVHALKEVAAMPYFKVYTDSLFKVRIFDKLTTAKECFLLKKG
ncbi:hypothetical protein [Peribacillus butanolivorans]